VASKALEVSKKIGEMLIFSVFRLSQG